jgi:uncharacterized protein (DUF2062 family)
MMWTKLTIVVGIALYVGLWVIAANGATSLVGPLAVPPILLVLVAGGNWLGHFMGVSSKPPKFKQPDDTQP